REIGTSDGRVPERPLRAANLRRLRREVPALLEHRAQARVAEALHECLEARQRAPEIEIVAEALEGRGALARLAGIELPRVQVERGRASAALETREGGARHRERQQAE